MAWKIQKFLSLKVELMELAESHWKKDSLLAHLVSNPHPAPNKNIHNLHKVIFLMDMNEISSVTS